MIKINRGGVDWGYIAEPRLYTYRADHCGWECYEDVGFRIVVRKLPCQMVVRGMAVRIVQGVGASLGYRSIRPQDVTYKVQGFRVVVRKPL